ncbi:MULTISPECIES: PAS domain-containing protein [unclassified Leptolyngbya]|uniref:PAS domain-containing protein n=1 Tax=unclassified Leptolyngbya TaxID=2650499 RepID=UPI001689B132|nr:MULTISPECIES: PAS domain-containing protein [unclassified Leptolyngbya]MBD1909725.1 PAS domain-containing protein [Leptolyngbya sp. FACHB-8]MBD2155991.1 PAS domain-containing protein [Leptolyngbya sp. FACHB-16]
MSNISEVCPPNTSPTLLLHTLEHLKQYCQSDADATQSSIYIYDLASQCNTYSSSSLGAMLGYSDQEMHSMGAMGLAQLIHPSDLDALSAHFQRLFTLADGEVISIEYRMKRADGTWCWLRSQETPMAMVDDAPLQVLGLIQNINHQKSILPFSDFLSLMV